MIQVVAINYIKKEKVEEFLKLAKLLEHETNTKDAGCISYRLVQDVKEPYTYAFIEAWETKDALDAHMAAKHFTDLVPKLQDFMEKPGAMNLFNTVE